jgi:molybdate transport system permease protein
MFSGDDLAAVWLTLRLASVVTVLLLLLGTPIAWWLAWTRSRWRGEVNALVALPLVLPPTVLGFYLLLLLGTNGPVGQLGAALGLGPLVFSFWGLVIGSLVYSLPFVVQPLSNAFQALGRNPLEQAATLGAGPLDRFFNVALPLSLPGYWTAAVLGFAHTVGEFGVVLMLGGNIPGQTRVVSVAIYDHVEMLNYGDAHRLAGFMLLFSFVVLLAVYSLGSGRRLFATAGP